MLTNYNPNKLIISSKVIKLLLLFAMAAYVYLIKKKNFFSIGKTKDLQKEIKKVRPDEVICSLKVDYPQAFEARLLRRYKSSRLPGSPYFQLTEFQLNDCKKQFSIKRKFSKGLGEEFFVALIFSQYSKRDLHSLKN